MNITEKVKRFNGLLNYGHSSIRVEEDLYALQLLSKILHSGSYVPMTSMAIRPYSLAFLMNELLINDRKRIIEFGSGMSTILLGRLIKSEGLNASICSVDENEGWVNLLQKIIRKEGLTEIVQINYSPLEIRKEATGKPRWYNEEIINARVSVGLFDMVIVDGPTAYNKEIEWSRYYALPYMQKKLNKDFVIFLDDADRPGEQSILSAWAKETGLPFTIFGGTLGVAYKGEHYACNPLRYAPELDFH